VTVWTETEQWPRSLMAGCDLSLQMAEEIIDSLRPEVDINPWGSWTEKEWDQVLR
jgi:hypothetical protein